MRFARLFLSLLIIPIACCALIEGCRANADTPITFSDGQVEASCETKAGDLVTVRLPANHTTGYSWRMADRGRAGALTHIGTDYIPGDAGLVGSPGFESWKFRAEHRDDEEIVFEYARPWEKDQAPARVKRLRVKIR